MPDDTLELETKIAYLEKHLNELSDVVYQQQKMIDALQSSQKSLKHKLNVLEDADHPASFNPSDEKPPHY